MIIGLTGLNGSGKGTAAEYLIKQKGFFYFSHSDEVREEVLKTDKEISREKLITTANTLRRQFGPSVLADRIIKKINLQKDTVVDSFRNPSEVKVFQALSQFELWFIDAARETRFQRIKSRGREQDPIAIEEFIRIENKELTTDDPSRQNLLGCKDLANRIIPNNGTRDELHAAIESALKRIKT